MLILIVGAILIVYSSWYIYEFKRRYVALSKMPGPSSIELFRNIFFASPVQIWNYVRRLSKQYPKIYMYWHTMHPVVSITHHDDMEVILSSMKHITKSKGYKILHSWLGTGLLTATGEKWRQRRKMLTPGFHFNVLQGFLKPFNDASTLLVEKLNADCIGQSVNILPIVTQFSLYTICETAMGTQLRTNEKRSQEYINAIFRLGEIVIRILVHPWLQFFPAFVLTPTYRKQRKLLTILHQFTRDVIQNRKQYFTSSQIINSKERLALLDILISAQRSTKDIDDDGIREEVDTFMFEGHDTITSCICFTLLMIANHAEVQNKVVEELDGIFGKSDRPATFQDLQNMSYMDKVIKEALRMCPSVPVISRSSEEDIQLPSGYTIPKGCIIQLYIYDLHRNPEVFPNPEKFDPERFSSENVLNRHPYAYIPFSAGPRNCIGQKFAILEVKTMISSTLRKFRLEPVDALIDIDFIFHFVLKSKDGIKMKFHKRLV